MNRNEKVLSEKRKAKRVNSEPDALSALRSKDRMATSLSEGSNQDTDSHNSGIMTRIKGLKSDIIKRVSRVMSDEDMRNLRLRTRLSNIQEPQQQAQNSSSAEGEVDDPNLKSHKKSDQSLHDVYKQLYFRRITSVDPPSHQDLRIPEKHVKNSPIAQRKSAFDIPKTKITEDTNKPEESDSEVYRVLQALKDGKSASEISCSRNIVQRTVKLDKSEDFPVQRDEQGGQFGLRIVGGKKVAGGMLCAFIASVTTGSPASRSPDLHEGDLVLKWNDKMLIGMTYEECQACLDSCESATLVISNFLRGSYRRYRPRSSNTSRTGSVESILRGTTHKWITLTRRGMLARYSEQSKMDESNTIDESMEEDDPDEQTDCEDDRSNIKLEMRLVHVAMENRLSVHLIQAANIPYREGTEGLDIFCKLYLIPDISTDGKKRSKTAIRTYNPYWNQHFEYQPITESELPDKKLEVAVMTHHWLLKDQLLGQVEIELGAKKVLSGQADWFYLQPPPTDLLSATLPDKRELSESDYSQLGSKSLSEMVREKVTIQHRITFSTFDLKKEIVPDIRRTASDTTKPTKALKQKSRQQQTGDEDSSDNVFTSVAIQTHLSNIKESDEQRPPIQVRGSPRRRPKVIRNKSAAKEHRKSDSSAYRRVCINSAHEIATITPDTHSSAYRRVCGNSAHEITNITPDTQSSKFRRTGRSNSEDFTTTKHRVLPKTPDKAKKVVSMTLPNKRMVSPLLSAQGQHFSQTKVILTAPSSEECTGNSSTDSLTSYRAAIHRPSPEGRLVGTGEASSQLGPGQISVTSKVTIPGSLVLTLGVDKNMLTLEVVQANNLPVRHNGVSPDTYVKTYILLEQNRSHKEKTTTVRCNCNPVFNERITYIVNPNNKILQVMVWDEVGTLRRSVLLGDILIDLSYIASQGPLQGRYKLFPSTYTKPP